jgi:hypothetical protein
MFWNGKVGKNLKLSRKSCLTLVLLIAIHASTASAQLLEQESATEVWDRSSAMASLHSVDFKTAVDDLINAASLADGDNTIQSLISLSRRNDWPQPAREAALLQFTRSLATRSSQSVDPDILQYLSEYQTQVMVFGEHGSEQPLFNIRAAAAGVENGWLRIDSARQASLILNESPGNWLAMFSTALHPAQRSGYLDALQEADPATILAVQNQSLQLPGDSPELTAVLAATIFLTNDPATAQWLLLSGKGAPLAPALNKLSVTFSIDELARLLEFAIQQAPLETAALAIAAWGPQLSSQPAIQQLLLDTLAEPTLGSSAALALANKPNIQTIRELQLLSNSEGLGAERARMALEINRKKLILEQR